MYFHDNIYFKSLIQLKAKVRRRKRETENSSTHASVHSTMPRVGPEGSQEPFLGLSYGLCRFGTLLPSQIYQPGAGSEQKHLGHKQHTPMEYGYHGQYPTIPQHWHLRNKLKRPAPWHGKLNFHLQCWHPIWVLICVLSAPLPIKIL